MFNCPEWGIAVQDIGIWRAASPSTTRTPIGTIRPTITSCNSLVRVCISSLAIIQDDVIYLQFFPPPGSNRAYLAEVEDNTACRQDAIIITPLLPDTTPPPPDTTTPPPLHLHHQVPLHLHHQIPLHLHHQIPLHLHCQILHLHHHIPLYQILLKSPPALHLLSWPLSSQPLPQLYWPLSSLC